MKLKQKLSIARMNTCVDQQKLTENILSLYN